jgi:hypothetical protein
MPSWPAEVIARERLSASFSDASPYHMESPSARTTAPPPEDQYAQLKTRLAKAPAAKANSAAMARVHSANFSVQRTRSIDPQKVTLNWLQGKDDDELDSPKDGAQLAEVQVSLVDQGMSGLDVPRAAGPGRSQWSGAQAHSAFVQSAMAAMDDTEQPSVYGGHQTRVLSAMRTRSLNLTSCSFASSVSPTQPVEVTVQAPLDTLQSDPDPEMHI